MKKIISAFLILCMLLTTVCAQEAEQTEHEIENSDAAETLFDFGIMTGDENGNLNGQKEVTRAEFAALVARVMKENGSAYAARFHDVGADHWAAAYIALMAQKGIIHGYEDGNFGPSDGVTLSQAVKILLGVLEQEDTGFRYPYDYLISAAQCGLTLGINAAPGDTLQRETAAKLIVNAMYIPKAVSGAILADTMDIAAYYVSPKGDDSRDGSRRNPWKSLAKAVKTVSGGAIIFLDDGVYEETEVAVLRGGKSENERLTIRAKSGCKPKIVYQAAENAQAVIPKGADYITIKGLRFAVAEDKDGQAATILIGANDICFAGNSIDGMTLVFENAKNGTIKENVFTGGCEAVCLKNTSDTIFKSNTFQKQRSTGLRVGEGSKNIQIYDNTFTVSEAQSHAAVYLGDTENSKAAEACVLLNNVIYNGGQSTTAVGIVLANTENCHFYHNIIDYTNGAVQFIGENVNSVFKNNIYAECSDNAYRMEETPKNFTSDYNCFYETYPITKEANSQFADPYFVSRGKDWHLMADSPAASSGTEIPTEIAGADGKMLTMGVRDFEGIERGVNRHMGIYGKTSGEFAVTPDDPSAKVLLNLDFKRGADRLIVSGGDWGVDNGVYRQTSVGAGRTTVCYEGGEDWINYEYSADVESPNSTSGNASGIIFRSDLTMQNMYAFRFLNPGSLEFCKWENNSYATIDKWEAAYELDTMYNLKVKAVGNTFTFFVNGVKVREVQDNSYMSGSVGLYCYKEANAYDNMKVIELK